MAWRIERGDCIEVMAAMPVASVDAIVTDPPYGLEFMGKEWDAPWKAVGNTGAVIQDPATERGGFQNGNGGRPYSRSRIEYGRGNRGESVAFQAWCEAWACEAFRVLKPGGHLLAFGGTRTYHRLTCGLEDVGFEIRDCLVWLYGSGFPKSLDVSKAIDKAAGVERTERPDPRWTERYPNGNGGVRSEKLRQAAHVIDRPMMTSDPATPEAERWNGWGTALKPAHEPIVLARKPLAGTAAGNVLEHGTGALNIDGCRIGTTKDVPASPRRAEQGAAYGDLSNAKGDEPGFDPNVGRWPANVLLDEDAAAMLDEQTGDSTSRVGKPRGADSGNGWGMTATGAEYDDAGGASRFFYCAKADTGERNAGLDGFEQRAQPAAWGDLGPIDGNPRKVDTGHIQSTRNPHPTVKPIDLMRWLVRLITPPSGTVLDPFAGSGTTGIAAVLEGFEFIGIERDKDYAKIAIARIEWWAKHPNGMEIVQAIRADRERRKVADAGQKSLFDL